ncbi:MAG: SO_0444 family Cu/Zn efflux transporter [Planctomycetota bacterium]
MTDWLLAYLNEIAFLVCEAAPYLLLGFLLAGLLKVLVPEDKIYRHLGGNSFRSVLLASLYGVPIPLCSCSVVPTAISLKKSGASKGATSSFLISTPETGVDSISVTWALLDPIMTIVRPIAAFLTAVVTGSFVNVLVNKGWDTEVTGDVDDITHGHDHDHDHDDCCDDDAPKSRFARTRFGRGTRYAFGPLLDDLTPWFIIGFLVSGLITLFIPDGLFQDIVPRGWASSLLMLVIGTPLYICATASTPVAVALIAKGLDPGAALVFLLVGPATNFTTLLIVSRFLGRRVLVIYLVCITGLALLFGGIVNGIYDASGINLSAVVSDKLDTGLGPFKIASGIVLTILLAVSATRLRLLSQWAGKIRQWCRPLGFDPTSRFARAFVFLVLIGLYASTAFSTIGPGEAGWVMRFGKNVRAVDEPGLVVHWPMPIERVETVRPDLVRAIELGFDRGLADADPVRDPGLRERIRNLTLEAEVVTGEETLLNVAYAAHYKVADAYAFRFRLSDPEATIRAFAESTLREVTVRRTTDEILVDARTEIELEVRARLQEELDTIGSGLEVTDLYIQNVHAPPRVHSAYRDVASALEDRERSLHQAQGEQAQKLFEALVQADDARREADIAAVRAKADAAGQALAFEARRSVYEEFPEVTRTRLMWEMMERVLAPLRLIVLLGEDVELDVYRLDEAKTETGSSDGGNTPRPVRLPFEDR